MEKILDVQDILASVREDEQQLERLIVGLRKEKKPLDPTNPDPSLPAGHSPCLYQPVEPCPLSV
jgi:hypothetical protein